jgi:hypothetical protein
MSYISAIRRQDEVLVWERTNEGRDIKTYPAPFYFYTPDPDGKFTSIYGDKLTRWDFNTSREFYAAKSECESGHVKMFESDISPEMKVLSEHYYNVPAPNLHLTLFDIEIDYVSELGFASIENPYAPVNSVAMYHAWSKRMVVYAVPPPGYQAPSTEELIQQLNDITPLPDDVTVELFLCKDEIADVFPD